MNTNQVTEPGENSAAPFASAILQSVFSKKNIVSDEKFDDDISQPGENQENANTVNQILSRLENKKEQAAVNLGIGAQEVETMPFDLSALETRADRIARLGDASETWGVSRRAVQPHDPFPFGGGNLDD